MTVIWGTTPYDGYMGSPLYDGLRDLNPSYTLRPRRRSTTSMLDDARVVIVRGARSLAAAEDRRQPGIHTRNNEGR